MEDLFPVLIFLIAGVASAISKAKKNQEKKEAEQRRYPTATAAKSAAAKPAQPYAPARPAVAQPTIIPPAVITNMPVQVITPTVHTHIQPDCDTHDLPGSLGVASTEGKDPCHEEQLTHAHSFAEPVQEEGGLTFDWSGENMVKAFVMQEVLTRPVNRAR